MNDCVMSLNLKFVSPFKKSLLLTKKEKCVCAETFQEMIYPLKENLYNYILKSLNFSEDANDIFQETVLRAYKYINSFTVRDDDKKRSFKTWIFSIAHNEIKHYHKKKWNPVKTIANHSNLVHDRFNEEIVRDIYELARQLKPKQRNVFFLYYYNKFSIREICAITKLKEGNIKFILNQSRKKIKKKLGVKNGK